MSTTIAVTGKGGSGKTALCAIMTRLLSAQSSSILLAIDADSAVNLSYALGVSPGRTVAEIRRQMIEDPYIRDKIKDKNIRAVMEEALAEGPGFKLLTMGRPEGPGCYCSVNDLLRYGIERLSRGFDLTLVDCEAGPEQVNRRVVRGVDMLIIVTDGSMRGFRVARSILDVIEKDESIRPARTGLVLNRHRGHTDPSSEDIDRRGLEILGRVPEDENITEYDRIGKPLTELPADSPGVKAVAGLLNKLVPERPDVK
jgi:CO dehydrogenase maturation factor